MTQTAVPHRGTATFAPSTQAPNLPRLGAWQIVGPPAVGRFARVYPARPLSAEASQPPCYALKVLRPEWQDDASAVQRFAREAVAGQVIRHAHVAPVLRTSLTSRPPFLVMPWLGGVTLERQLAAGRSFSVPEALWIARQAAAALAAFEEAGYVHGDIAPANIQLSPEGHATLIDLGFAHRPDQPFAPSDCVFGTPGYLAPERRAARGRPDIRADIFGLGVVLAELLVSGNRDDRRLDSNDAPERAATMARLLRSMIGLPDGLRTLVQQMLAYEPLRRPQTPGEVVRRLTSLEIATFADRVW